MHTAAVTAAAGGGPSPAGRKKEVQRLKTFSRRERKSWLSSFAIFSSMHKKILGERNQDVGKRIKEEKEKRAF